MATILRDSQQVALSYTATSKKGNPTSVQDPAWSSSDESVVTVAGNTTGGATAKAVGPTGTATITLTGDADLGEGVKPVRGVLDIEVVAGDAAVFNITVATATEQEDPAPTPEPTPEPAPPVEPPVEPPA